MARTRTIEETAAGHAPPCLCHPGGMVARVAAAHYPSSAVQDSSRDLSWQQALAGSVRLVAIGMPGAVGPDKVEHTKVVQAAAVPPAAAIQPGPKRPVTSEDHHLPDHLSVGDGWPWGAMGGHGGPPVTRHKKYERRKVRCERAGKDRHQTDAGRIKTNNDADERKGTGKGAKRRSGNGERGKSQQHPAPNHAAPVLPPRRRTCDNKTARDHEGRIPSGGCRVQAAGTILAARHLPHDTCSTTPQC